jgi:hypothetical protein
MADIERPGTRVLIERPHEEWLQRIAHAYIAGSDTSDEMSRYAASRSSHAVEVDPTFPPIAIGQGPKSRAEDALQSMLAPDNKTKFLLAGTLRDGAHADKPDKKGDVLYADPALAPLLSPCPPTCGTSRYVGDADTVRHNLKCDVLHNQGLDGTGVAIAIVDSGIYLPRLELLLGQFLPKARAIKLDAANSWQPPGMVTKPGFQRVGHGTMCAYDALIAAPNATLLDYPMLMVRRLGDHRTTGSVAAAIQAYFNLILTWTLRPHAYKALVVSNSWGIFNRTLEDFPPGDPRRFIDNPDHVFRLIIRMLIRAGADVVFCGNNCGNASNCAGGCASRTCLGERNGTIMGANAYSEVLTVGGCDTDDKVVGYSSRGPSIANMPQEKPDLVAYTHFLGSRIVGAKIPDTGVSAACPVAAGCVAALRTRFKPDAVKSARLFEVLRNTARRPAGGPPGWRPDDGRGIIDPVAALAALP